MVGLYIFTTVCLLSLEVSFGAVGTLPLKVAALLPVSATATVGCVRDGKTYAPIQSFHPTPCENCMCSPTYGKIMCAIVDCYFTPCVDAVHDPERCCPQCPNGETCKAPDGTIIKKGETYKPDSHTICSCPTVFGRLSAQCTYIMSAPPVSAHVDPLVVS